MPNVAEARGLLNSADVLFTADQVSAAVEKMAEDITALLGNSYPLVLSVMGGAVVFTGQLLPRLALIEDPDLALTDATRDLRVCFRLLDLQQHLPAEVRHELEPVLAALHDYFRACARAHRQLPLPAALLERLEASLAVLLELPGGAAHKATEALAGLRLALFPEPSDDGAAPAPLAPAGAPA